VTGRPRFRLLRDLFAFGSDRRRSWMIPLVIVLLLVAAIAGVGALAPYGLFLYPL
jgi:hypothetical protein